MFMRILTWWCGIGNSNPYALRQQILSLSWLPLHQSRIFYLKPTSYLIAISSIGPWMMSFCPYITFTIVSLCQWNTIASYGKCLLVIRRCLKLYPVSMSVRCDIDLTVIFKSCRALSSSFRCAILYLSIPIPFIMPNRLTSAPYLALLSNYAIHAYLICLTHVPDIMMAVHQTPLSCFVTPIWTMSGLSDFSTIIFTFSIIPPLILFVKR